MDRKSLSSVDVRFLVRELQSLLNAKIDNIFQYGTIFYLQMHNAEHGKQLLKLVLPDFCCLTDIKAEQSANQSGFSSLLRKYLSNTRIEELKQFQNERIIIIKLKGKEESWLLIAELFSKGNLILCDEQMLIKACLFSQKWSLREIKPGLNYIFPESVDPFSLHKDELKDIFRKSSRDSVVKAFAMDLGFGGLFAEELCLRLHIDKEQKPSDLSDTVVAGLTKELKGLLDQYQPSLIFDADAKVIDFSPIPLERYDSFEQKKVSSLSEAIDTFLREYIPKKKKNDKYDLEIKKFHTILEQQEKSLGLIQQEIDEERKKGDLLYEKYAVVKEVLDTLKSAREKYSWKEIKQKLKNHPLIKNVDEETGKISLDL